MKAGFVYIVTNKRHTVLYTGVTSQLRGRIRKHREKFYPNSFSAQYNCHILVYYERYDSIIDAIRREKQIKAGPRKRKIALINKFNPDWNDLFDTL